MSQRELTPKQTRFVEEYLLDLNAAQAAIRAGFSPRTAKETAYKLLRQPIIAQRIYEAKLARSKRTGISVDAVLQEYWLRATADPRELAEVHIVCCRYCHGRDFQYQRTRAEVARARRKWEKAQPDGAPAFDEQGGEGFNATRPPHPDCPECFGEGVKRPVVRDTRTLSPMGQRLYAGFRVTSRGGVEVRMHDPMPALDKVAEHIGLFVERIEMSGPNGGPIPIAAVTVRQKIADRIGGLASRIAIAAPNGNGKNGKHE